MNINLRFAYFMISRDIMWIRFSKSGRGFSIKRTAPLFSERIGKVKTTPLLFGWRLRRLEAFKLGERIG